MWKTAISSTVLAHAALLLSALCVVADCVPSKFLAMPNVAEGACSSWWGCLGAYL